MGSDALNERIDDAHDGVMQGCRCGSHTSHTRAVSGMCEVVKLKRVGCLGIAPVRFSLELA